MEPILGTVAIGAAGNIIATSAGHIYNYIWRYLRNTAAIREAISSGHHEQKSIDDAILKAVTTGFAQAGILDGHHLSALYVVTQSPGLFLHIIDASLLSEDDAHVWPLIEDIYSSHGGNVPDSRQFVLQLRAGLNASLSSLSLVDIDSPDGRNLLQKIREDRFRRVDAAIANLDEVYSASSSSSILKDISQYADREKYIFRKIAEGTVRVVKEVDVHGAFGDIHRVELDKVFVDLHLRRHTANPSIHRHFLLEREYLDRDIDLPLDGGYIHGWRGLHNASQRRVLLGDPGGGKSTHAKKITLEVAKDFLDQGNTIPLFIHLRYFAAARTKNPTLGMLKYIASVVREFVPDVEELELEKALHYILSLGRANVVFDGLDEVLSGATRLEIAKLVNNFCDQYILSSFLVTSRIVGYETAPMREFDHFFVDTLVDRQVESLFLHVSTAVLNKTMEIAQFELPAFMGEARKRAGELITNPLILTLIIIVHSRRKEIPDNRADLYATCASLLFERWDNYRDIQPDLPERYRLNELLMHISSILYEEPVYGGRINKSDLYDISKKFFLNDYSNNAQGRAAEAARNLVDHLTGRAWILHEFGDQVFEFTHRTFLEYFFAQAMVGRFESTEELLNELMPFISQGQRTVPAHLALQIKCRDKRIVSDRIASHLGSVLANDTTHESRAFCADSLEYLTPSGDNLLKFVSELASVAMRSVDQSVIIKILSTENPLRPIILTSFSERFSSARTLRDLSKYGEVLEYVINILQWEKETESGKIILNMVRRIAKLQYKSPYIFKFLFDCGSFYDMELVRKYKHRIWFNRWSRKRALRVVDDAFMMIEDTLSAVGDACTSPSRYAELAMVLSEEKIDEFVPKVDPASLGGFLYSRTELKVREFEDLEDNIIRAIAFAALLASEAIEVGPYPQYWGDEFLGRIIDEGIKRASPEARQSLELWRDAKLSFFFDRIYPGERIRRFERALR